VIFSRGNVRGREAGYQEEEMAELRPRTEDDRRRQPIRERFFPGTSGADIVGR